MEFRESARKHGIDDKDTNHAIDHALVTAELGPEKELHLGPDRAGNFLEVVTVSRQGQELLVIHSMKMRKQYEPYLQGLENDDAP